MRYQISDIEDQIIATLTRETLTGTISSSGTAVTGAGTAFDTELSVGDEIIAPSDESGAEVLTVLTITDATHLTLSAAPSSALSGDEFALRFPDDERFECDTHAGDISSNTFLIPQLMEGLVRRLPFILVQYQGRSSGKGDRDSAAGVYMHTLVFRLYVGGKSLRSGQETARGVYAMLAIVYDRLHGRVPRMSSNQVNPGLPRLEGVPISTSGFNPLSPLMETGGSDERLVVNLPEIKVYRMDFQIRLVA